MPLPGPVIKYKYTQFPDDRISLEYPHGSAIDFVKPAFEGYGNGGGYYKEGGCHAAKRQPGEERNHVLLW